MLESEIKKLTDAVITLTDAMHTVRLPAAAPAAAAAAAPAADAAVVAPVAEAAAAVVPTIDIPVVEPTAVVVDLKMITQGIILLCKTCGREAAAVLMAEYGAQKVPDLKAVPEKYGEIFGKINALIEAKK